MATAKKPPAATPAKPDPDGYKIKAEEWDKSHFPGGATKYPTRYPAEAALVNSL